MRLIKNLSLINQRLDEKDIAMSVKMIGSGYEITAKKKGIEYKIVVTKHSIVDSIVSEIENGIGK